MTGAADGNDTHRMLSWLMAIVTRIVLLRKTVPLAVSACFAISSLSYERNANPRNSPLLSYMILMSRTFPYTLNLLRRSLRLVSGERLET